jgi:phenylacetate-CoA ligase
MWNPQIETMARDRLGALQLTRLKETVARILRFVPPQAEQLRASGVNAAEDVSTLDDLQRLPFTNKSFLREHYPFGLLAVPREQVARVHGSSGTRGKPTIAAYTRDDLAMWSEVMARVLSLAHVRPGMVVHNAYGYGLFTGGFGFHQGAELVGCTVIPMSGGLSERQIMMLQDLGGQVLCCTPSYALNLAEVMNKLGVDARSLRLQVGIFGAEPWTEEMRDQIEEQLDITALNVYGLSEIVGPGVSCECIEAQDGGHIQEDHFLAEIIDPHTGDSLEPGREGELVLTTLTKEAIPLVRYRTGDITSLNLEPCVCGRTSARMARLRGRHDDMLIIRGVNLYPTEVERVLLSVSNVMPHYQMIVERPSVMDELTVVCEPAGNGTSPEDLRVQVQQALFEATGLTINVVVLAPGEIPRSEGKAVRVIDRRVAAR